MQKRHALTWGRPTRTKAEARHRAGPAAVLGRKAPEARAGPAARRWKARKARASSRPARVPGSRCLGAPSIVVGAREGVAASIDKATPWGRQAPHLWCGAQLRPGRPPREPTGPRARREGPRRTRDAQGPKTRPWRGAREGGCRAMTSARTSDGTPMSAARCRAPGSAAAPSS